MNPNADSTNGHLDRKTAFGYAKAWARFEHDDISKIHEEPSGDFYGTLGSIAFDYIENAKVLTVRAAAQPWAKRLVNRSDILEELHAIEKQDPKALDFSHFELTSGRWQKDNSEPWLYLRIDIKDDSQGDEQVVQRLKSLGDMAHLWFRVKLSQEPSEMNKFYSFEIY